MRLAFGRLNTRPMIRWPKRVQPDLSVATHFLPAESIAWPIANKKLRARNAMVITDYDVHAMWLCRTVGRYCLAMEGAAEYLAHIGVRRQKWGFPLLRSLPYLRSRPGARAFGTICCNNLPAAAWKIATLLDDRLERAREAAGEFGKPVAAAAIAEDALRLLD